MLLNYKEQIEKIGVILASESPRRKDICEKLGLQVEILPSGFEENFDYRDFQSPEAYSLFNAQKKSNIQTDKIVISADSIVEIDGVVLEKPLNREDCVRMISMLNGRAHKVHTALVVKFKGVSRGNVTTTLVYFDNLDQETIQAYADTSDWRGKAGGYGIQDGSGGSFVKMIEGCYYNVVGLPINTLVNSIVAVLSSDSN